MLKAIVFDLDGVIVDSEPVHYRAFLQVARQHGVDFDYQEYLNRYIGYDDRDGFRAMLTDVSVNTPDTEIDDATIRDLCIQKADVFESIIQQGAPPISGVVSLIEESRKQLPLAIATGASRPDAKLLLGAMGLLDAFDPIVSADDVVRSKPHPQTYTLAVQGLGQRKPDLDITPSDCLSIEDTPAGIESALAAGLQTLGLASTGPIAQLHRADRSIETLENVNLQKLREWFD